MQLYAFDSFQCLTLAENAEKQKDYICLECGEIVRLRGGLHRKNHFFHLQSDRSCFLSGKSMTHLQVQCRIQQILPEGESQLEYRFSKINRIADVVWMKEKIVFEVQCSSISQEEVKRRNRDYQKEGFQVVWILHESKFNLWKVTAAEMFLKDSSYYFTDINANGLGTIYDQFDYVHLGLRVKRLPKLPINLGKMHQSSKLSSSYTFIPRCIQQRAAKRLVYFEGDLMNCFLKKLQQNYMKEVRQMESLFLIKPKTPRSFVKTVTNLFNQLARNTYHLFIQFLLEKACR